MSSLVDLTGKRMEHLLVLKRAGSDNSKRATWLCRCDCGREVIIGGRALVRGQKSCGCMTKEILKKAQTKHGKCYTRLYDVWRCMIGRCYLPNNTSYKYYGAKGVAICDEWRNDFQAFHDWAMSSGYDENAPRGKCTIDRINVDGNYEPDNCRWVDMKVQDENRRRDENGEITLMRNMVKIDGVEKPLKVWCRIYGIQAQTIRYRKNHGMDLISAITTPKRKQKRDKEQTQND